ncbi:DNA-binding protein [Idiomarina sp. WRN-38]|jgi:putative transcriptional regulator|uniref:helix-turn-helix domain-containing protein n=1 Tax=unclassified Idiomarina TaxID=2614829 RepID=UPI0007335849|nr:MULTISPECIES: DNA-binding transcriptional regulator [unclassified Idiomarina]KTG28962.1 DNA-binding protein [Idiomarina sp. H105]MBF38989.1 transcriptional regulator [Idiomarinaceae bacterium]OAF09727.1 DNA-binding protein [Idiomarina sp. WRN-38]MCJ8316796.1 DNA-binding transcriptional regulator [Idiomarina sp.]NQZ16332.1 DNA-binding transcriptional regulator [Idiomarina sp.]|tara:strand:+ start:56048 stop:56350 length:303 start_codon:yes stop_codon:yes gene_type:complete
MSDILKSVHRTAKGLKSSGVIDKTTMRQFDALCLTNVHEFTADQVRALRLKYKLSQPVFAQYLNVSDKLVKKWEQGDSKPRGAALKMLTIAEKKGLEVIA